MNIESNRPITPRRQRRIEDMTARNLGPHSRRSHLYSCERFAAFLERSPDTATADEIRRLLAMAASSKVRAMLSLAYGCGLRAGEVVRLGVGDMDSARNIIRIVPAKGRKDRNVMLPADVPGPLRQWWKERPRRQDKDVALAERCRTAALGGPVKRCEDCADEHIAYNSCRNRHGPKCRGAAAKDWLAARSNPHSAGQHRR